MGLYERDYALAPEALERTRAKASKSRVHKRSCFTGIQVPDAMVSELAVDGARIELAQPRKPARRKSWLAAGWSAVRSVLFSR